MKRVIRVEQAPAQHWVGDGFPVQSMFSYQEGAEAFSPFLLLDYAAPTTFSPTAPSDHRRGVGTHPHRGFETVTIVYAGEVEHRDSTGKGGVIGPGDVQWMTAGGGILHQEFHSAAYSRSGGPFQMVQLWVNLPAKDKMAAPGYQAIVDASIPVVSLGTTGAVRVIAGEYAGHKGPAQTFTSMNVWDVQLGAGQTVDLPQPDGWTTLFIVLGGTVQVNSDAVARESQMVILSREGSDVRIEANNDARVLLLAGQPIEEPIVGYGPFVMNSKQEIAQAIKDFNSGKFGQMD
jgi:quercetin 2,3-dioxygenase